MMNFDLTSATSSISALQALAGDSAEAKQNITALSEMVADADYTIKQLTRALREETEPPTFMGEPISPFVRVPRVPNDALLRPFYECPPEELRIAWNAMLYIAERRGIAGVPGAGKTVDGPVTVAPATSQSGGRE